MSYRGIVSDWNGSLFEYPTDEVQNKMIGYAILEDAKQAVMKGKIWRLRDIAGLLGAKGKLKRRLREYKDGKIDLWRVYEPFNEVLRGRPASLVYGVLDAYARESAGKVDGRILRPIRAVHDNGKATGILSVSCDYSIRRILEESGYQNIFDNIIAHTLETRDGRVVGFASNLRGKPEELVLLCWSQGFRERDVIYFGDLDDDIPVADLIPQGNFVVPFFASGEFRESMASRYGAFVPENEADLDRYLKMK